MTFTTDERAFMVREPILSKMAIGGHPVHPTVIHFHVAALIGVIVTDVGYLVTHDEFWARARLWLAGIGAFGGWIAGSIGLIDLLLVTRIRCLITAWSHAILAVMMRSEEHTSELQSRGHLVCRL